MEARRLDEREAMLDAHDVTYWLDAPEGVPCRLCGRPTTSGLRICNLHREEREALRAERKRGIVRQNESSIRRQPEQLTLALETAA